MLRVWAKGRRRESIKTIIYSKRRALGRFSPEGISRNAWSVGPCSAVRKNHSYENIRLLRCVVIMFVWCLSHACFVCDGTPGMRMGLAVASSTASQTQAYLHTIANIY